MFPRAWQPTSCLVMWYVGQGSEREQLYLLRSLPVFSHFPGYPQSNWALLVLIPGWVGFCMFWDPVGLSNDLSCEAGSFSCCCLNPHRCFQSEVLRLYFPALEPWVARLSCSPVFPPGLFAHKCGTAQSASHCSPQSSSSCLAMSPRHPGCPSPPLLLV